MIEVWKDIPGYEGHYQVSNLGSVKSIERLRRTKGTGITKVCERIVKPTIDKFGYCKVCLFKNGKRKYCKPHRLVAIAFIPNPDNKPEVNHKDGNKTNNNVSNLEWNTASENMRHAFANGLNGGERKKNRMPVWQFDKAHNLIATYPSIYAAEKKTGIKNIWMCCTGKYKVAGGYIWKCAKRKE